MQPLFHQSRELCLIIFAAAIFTGCDQIAEVYSGIGEKTTSDAKTSVDDNIEPEQVANIENASAGSEEEADPGPVSADDPGSAESEDAESDDGSGGRNVDQYPRLPRNVTWKPISASSGGNLTVVLWGNGGGEKNYEPGSLRVEHDDGVKYPRKYVRRDDPDNGERAPKFYFDVQGGWFAGKDPVLFWNLGAYRVLHPEKRQGKNEHKK